MTGRSEQQYGHTWPPAVSDGSTTDHEGNAPTAHSTEPEPETAAVTGASTPARYTPDGFKYRLTDGYISLSGLVTDHLNGEVGQQVYAYQHSRGLLLCLTNGPEAIASYTLQESGQLVLYRQSTKHLNAEDGDAVRVHRHPRGLLVEGDAE